jgi:UbiD family decarboxylase
MAYYKELREHIKALEAHNKLQVINREINKDTELHPLVRLQFRGLPEKDRKAFLFTNVIDAQGRKYDSPVLIASHAASRDVYAIGLMCKPDEIPGKWAEARRKPINPVIVAKGPVHEEIHMGATLLDHDGLLEFPIPISTPGFDNAPYLTAANWVSKDPETGIRNVGNYRGMVKSKTRLGILNHPSKDLRTSWEKCRKLKKPLQAAIVIGPVPSVGYTATVRFPYGVDEYTISGGLAGEPLELVKCKTVDIEVPATSEIVIEGELPTDSMEREGPFGEYTGYMAPEEINPYFNVTCITHRKKPIYNAFLSQFPPSESSVMRRIGEEANVLRFLKSDLGLPVTAVALHETSSAQPLCIVSIKKLHNSQVWQALHGIVARTGKQKIVIAVDDDIDPYNADSVNWAMSWRVQPHRDIKIVAGMVSELDPSIAPPNETRTSYPVPSGCSAMLIDATAKWDYPPLSLPKQEFMERAKKIWEEEGLPNLHLVKPWYGYSMGFWTDEFEDEAQLALKGEYFQTGEKLANQRIIL